jgi:ubiquinone/menaquinone biosynthesis C-methylase UbiE
VSRSGSISFDRAAAYYDTTRTPDDASTRKVVELLADRLAGSGRALEVGIGTGQVGLPLARAGIDVIGFDLSAGMMTQLRCKAGDRVIPLVQADATRMPFADGSFGGVYRRWVLHPIAAWTDAVAEMDRVASSEGVIAIEPGGFSGAFGDVYLRFVDLLGDAVRLPGLDLIDREASLDDAMNALGRRLADVVPVTYDRKASIADQLDRIPSKVFAWTWNVPDDELREATQQVRSWATERFDIDAPVADLPTRWRIYTRAA